MNEILSKTSIESISLGDALRGRRSIRHFTDEPVDPEIIKRAITAATLAPSPHGTAPWRFCVLSSESSRKKLAEEMGRNFLSDMEKEGVPIEERMRRHKGSIQLLSGAPALILTALSFDALDTYDDSEKQERENMMAEHSLGAALQSLMLALTAEGMASVWRCAPLFCPETARDALALPADWVPRALILVGHPAAPPPPKKTSSPEIITR
ncbi:MAG: nitroreductase family protein [Nitrospinaceae bacterium]|jgi:coenzyme F420-0:L-glutamate ligase/coenzyme F420-1:gamma-L-glutamate ligase|nr:nitroreductase family protein [Nitrospinaceae bacterium]MBT3435492.1 nitroreductase family protein [Nitrospinaceae bacterium]MBT3822862.1 nitroreductase family protein [Nitrospinaceae bacterium]MBT4094592.1 nitroreductase family protein [Nitrospinaceae bacterium]MBT4430553.1 nitroreductase family protein [Nitrospinaceae bacterium]